MNSHPDATQTSLQIKHSWVPINENEEKEKFFVNHQTPKFKYENPISITRYFTSKRMGSINFDLYYDAKAILDKIQEKFGSFDRYILNSLGACLSLDNIKLQVQNYLEERKLVDSVTISYVRNISCSATLNSLGYSRCLNKPEFRKYNLLINIRPDNIFLREHGIQCLLDHELGTHFIRAFNEGLQPWYWNRPRFHLSNTNKYESKQIEEGLATINTLLAAKEKYLGMPALLYYATCMAHFLTFGQLFDHLQKYIINRDHRWKHCVRIKRSLKSVNELGGYAKDQCYFEGALYLLANVKHIDFNLLCCGKVTIKDLSRIKRIARLHFCRIPQFMANMKQYKKELISLAKLNGVAIIPFVPHPTEKPDKLPKLSTKLDHSTDIVKINHYLKTKKSNINCSLNENINSNLPIM